MLSNSIRILLRSCAQSAKLRGSIKIDFLAGLERGSLSLMGALHENPHPPFPGMSDPRRIRKNFFLDHCPVWISAILSLGKKMVRCLNHHTMIKSFRLISPSPDGTKRGRQLPPSRRGGGRLSVLLPGSQACLARHQKPGQPGRAGRRRSLPTGAGQAG
jgi:hypothetical protein